VARREGRPFSESQSEDSNGYTSMVVRGIRGGVNKEEEVYSACALRRKKAASACHAWTIIRGEKSSIKEPEPHRGTLESWKHENRAIPSDIGRASKKPS